MEYWMLVEVLEKSIEKNGSIPLTTSHLLNILKVASRLEDGLQDDAHDYMWK